MTVFLREGRVSVEVGEQVGIVAFHDNAHGDDETPDYCPWVFSDSLERRKIVFSFGTETSLVGCILSWFAGCFDIVVLSMRDRSVESFFAHLVGDRDADADAD
jgi:hypothetical protein